MPRFRLSRRAVLRGAYGTAIGLPFLECMFHGHTARAQAALPQRYFLFHCPTSLVGSGSQREAMTPTTAGANYAITPGLQPLVDRDIKQDVSVISGLFCAPIDVPGGYKRDHHGQAPYAVMTGVRSGWRGTLWRAQGWTADQLVARRIGTTTRLPYLYYQLDTQRTGTAICHEEGIGFAEETPPVYKAIQSQTSPAGAYRQLFAGFIPPSAMPDPKVELELRLRRSSLSYASERITALKGRLGAQDKRTLDEHLTKVRALEQRLLATQPPVISPTCRDPGALVDPADVSTNVPDQPRRADLFVDLIEMAFACDISRVVSFQGASAMTGSGMRHPQWASIGGLHAEVQHASTQADLDRANRWFVDVYAKVLQKLKATSEGTATVLDRTAAVFVMEGGKGLSVDDQRSGDGGADPNHSVDNALMMLGGRAGGLKPGKHIDIKGRDLHHAVVFNSAMKALGVPGQLGEISGTLDELF